MEFSAQTASGIQDTLDADALTSYISWTGKNGEPYYPVIPNADSSGWESDKATGKKVIPWVTTGHDTEPRLDHPVSWYTVPAGDWVADGTPEQIGGNVQSVLNWIKKNPETAETQAFIMYAWNEFDEGGWICPTFGNNTRILDGVKKVLITPQKD
jgi:hypothetical protein